MTLPNILRSIVRWLFPPTQRLHYCYNFSTGVRSRCSPFVDTLHKACSSDASDAPARVEALIKAGTDELDAYDASGNTPLMYACKAGCPLRVRLLIDAGADVHRTTSNGYALLDIASGYRHDVVVRLLINAGVDVNYAHPRSLPSVGYTALHWACTPDCTNRDAGYRYPPIDDGFPDALPCVRALINAGADVHRIADCDGNTALHLACTFGDLSVAQALLNAGAAINVVNAQGQTPRCCAEQSGCVPLVELLVEQERKGLLLSCLPQTLSRGRSVRL